jgi:hypothetical protein
MRAMEPKLTLPMA